MKEQNRNLSESIENHSVEGLEIIQGKSSFYAHGLLYIILSLIISILIWSYFAKNDVIITVKGKLDQESGSSKVYSPTDGELVDIYIAEGVPVVKDQIIARVKSSNAIRAATDAQQAYLRLKEIEKEKLQFPSTRELMGKEIQSIKNQISLMAKELENLKTIGMEKLSESQQNKLKLTRLQMEEAERSRDAAEEIYGKFNRLSQTAGGGGISKQQLQAKEIEYKNAEAGYRRNLAELEQLEQQFSNQTISQQKQIEQIKMGLVRIQLQHTEKIQQRDRSEDQINLKYQMAQNAYQAASKVSFTDLDQDNFIVIKAPISGEVTQVSFKQTGEKIQSVKPIAMISPKDAGKILSIIIPDRDRGLLKIGQTAKLKFQAFPYHRFGFIQGKIKALSTNAVPSRDGQPYYKGKIDLERDYFMSNDVKIPLRYGMMAIAEISVQKRRFIDLALDPFRKI